MPQRGCTFCGARPLTREHVWPTWLSDVLGRHPKEFPGAYILETGEDHKTRRLIPSKRRFELTARCVCSACNSGWMNRIEGAARPYLEPMILGEPCEAGVEAQSAISAWIALRIMVSVHAHPSRYSLYDDWIRWMYENHSAPREWRIWLAAYHGSITNGYETRSIPSKTSEVGRLDDDDLIRTGVITTFFAGHLALKVAGLRPFTLRTPSASRLLPIHPSPGVALRWPPKRIFTDPSIDHLFDLFLRRGSSRIREQLDIQ